MNTLIRIIVTSIISLLMLSCNFSMNLGEGVDGNGDVVTVERNISTDFDQIKVSQGLDLYITQSNDVSLTVEADETAGSETLRASSTHGGRSLTCYCHA